MKNAVVNVKKSAVEAFYGMLPEGTIDSLLNRRVFVTSNNKKLFSLRNMGATSRKRALTFFTKEPDTIEWIKSFKPSDQFLDIGANIGIYSLYAASNGIRTVSIEPQAMNYACLVINVIDNKLGNLISTYPFCSHETLTISQLRLLEGSGWGTANSSFDRKCSSHGKEISYENEHGSLGIPLDDLVERINFLPTHIKIDVDGNELLVLKGSKKLLSNKGIESVLVELAEDHPEYRESINILEEAGFYIAQKGSHYGTLANYIFKKR